VAPAPPGGAAAPGDSARDELSSSAPDPLEVPGAYVLRDATDPLTFYVRLPEGTREGTVELRGDAADLVSLSVPAPGVLADELSAPYRVALPVTSRFRHALYDARRWSPIRPSNDAELLAAGRYVDLEKQARIEEIAPAAPLPEIILAPRGATSTHYLVQTTYVPKGGSLPPGAAVPLRGEAVLRVAAQGPRARRITATYRVDKAALGGTVSLLIDGQEAASAPVMTLTGVIEASASAGPHRVSVDGLGAAGRVFVDAPPEGGGQVFQRKSVYGMDRAHPLTFSIQRKKTEHLTLVLQVISAQTGIPWSMRYAIEEGDVKTLTGHPFMHLTRTEGALSGISGDTGTGSLGDNLLGGASPVALSRDIITLGDDLGTGVLRVRLALESPNAAWVRAVLVGQAGAPLGEEAPRVWTREGE
jgi:hypothetical protein